MKFGPKSLLNAPLTDMTVDSLAAALAKLSEIGMGDAGVNLPDGVAINSIELVAAGAVAAHVVLKRNGTRPEASLLLRKCPCCGGAAYVRVVGESLDRKFGAVCEECCTICCQSKTLEEVVRLWDVNGIID